MTYRVWGVVQVLGAVCFMAGMASMRFAFLDAVPVAGRYALVGLGIALLIVGSWGRGRADR